MTPFRIILYSVLKGKFFDLEYCINCSVREYVACTNVDEYFDIGMVEKQELVEVGLGIKVSKPIPVKKGLKGGNWIFSSLSHYGVLAIHSFAAGRRVQLTDLGNGRQIDISVTNSTQTGFCDDSLIMLIYGEPLGMCSVEEIFSKRSVDILKRIGSVEVDPLVDVSRLQSTRTLLFTSTSCLPYEFDVDSKAIRKLEIGKDVLSFASLTGIDVGLRGVFKEELNEEYTYSLEEDNSVTLVLDHYARSFYTVVPSFSNNTNIGMSMKIYCLGNFFTYTSKGARLETPFKYQDYQSIVRLFQDIFLVYNANTLEWSLVKIVVP